MPRGYDAYARLFHPALTHGDRHVRWSTVADWSGKTYHNLMSFEGISVPKLGYGSAKQPWAYEPVEDMIEPEDIVELSGFLSDYTSTPDQYYFAVWDGYGSFSAGASALMTTSGGIPLLPPVDVERANSNCVESQEELSVTFRVKSYQGERCLRMELRITISFRIQAVRATFFGLPAANSRW